MEENVTTKVTKAFYHMSHIRFSCLRCVYFRTHKMKPQRGSPIHLSYLTDTEAKSKIFFIRSVVILKGFIPSDLSKNFCKSV